MMGREGVSLQMVIVSNAGGPARPEPASGCHGGGRSSAQRYSEMGQVESCGAVPSARGESTHPCQDGGQPCAQSAVS